MEWTNIIAIVAALAIAWFTFKQKRPASVQIAVIIGLLGGGYYFFIMEDKKPGTIDYSGLGDVFQDPLGPRRGGGGGY